MWPNYYDVRFTGIGKILHDISKMPRILLPDINSGITFISVIDKETVHYLSHVLRLEVGDRINIFDGKGKEFCGRIKKMDRKKIAFEIISSKDMAKGCGLNITLACAIPKKAKFDYIIEKTTELGVDRIIPMITERTIVSLDEKTCLSKLNRWKKIGQEASKQSHRALLPKIEGVSKFSEVLKQASLFDLAIIACLYDERKDLSGILKSFKGNSVLALIGPEGDFSPQEISQARGAGCIAVEFTDTVLKVDTAAIFLVSILKFSIR